MNELDLFAAAIAITEPTEREALLDRECSGQPELRKRLDQLLEQHARSHQLLDGPNGADLYEATALAPTKSLTDVVIAGRYKILEQIGDGGMGTVWMAEQREPVKRLVAVKLIKAGMDTKAVLARFEAERQALALMDHPNIAKVFDAGTDDVRPYFVMELVKGLPLTEYCDARRLSVNDRLDLFVQICSAVQHAHQKAVIHRDLKPSNILVTEHDGKPIPKVIDFGLAKALGPTGMLTERTLHTAFGTVVGTPLYMAPEQVGINSVDVDTRTDVYALGVILFELLTGSTPLEKGRFKEAAWEEVKRLIRDEEPPRPSTRLSSDKTLPRLAESRQVEPAELNRLVRGELDWIVMKALEKERARRYETATGLARDVQRYLAGEAVEACPPTLAYRLRKTVQKHRAVILTTASMVAVLMVGVVLSTWQAIRATEAEARALASAQRETKERAIAELAARERETTIDVFGDVLEQFNPYRHPTGNPSIQEVLGQACASLDTNDELTPLIRAKVRGVFGRMQMKLHQYEEAIDQLRRSYEDLAGELGEDHLDALAALEEYGSALVQGRTSVEDLKLAERKLRQVHESRVRIQGAGHPDQLEMVNGSLGKVFFYLAEYSRLEELCRNALRDALANPAVGEQHMVTAGIELRLANVLMRSTKKSDWDEARDLSRRGIRTFEAKLGPNDPSTLHANMQLVVLQMHETTDLAEWVRRLHELAKRIREACGTEYDRRVERAYNWLAYSSLLAGDLLLLDEYTKKMLDVTPRILGERHPHMRPAYTLRAWYHVQVGDYEQAEVELKKVFSPVFRELTDLEGGWDDKQLSLSRALMAECILHRTECTNADFVKAEEYLQQAETLMGKRSQESDGGEWEAEVVRSHRLQQWVRLYTRWNKPDSAAVWQAKLDEMTEK